MKLEYDKGKVVVDKLYLDSRRPYRMTVIINDGIYTIPNEYFMHGYKVADKFVKAPAGYRLQPGYVDECAQYEYLLRGLIPRGGIKPFVGKAATPEELDEIKARYQIKDISPESETSKGNIFGEELTVKYKTIKIYAADPADAYRICQDLSTLGIEVAHDGDSGVAVRIS